MGGRHEAHHGGFTDDRRQLWLSGLAMSGTEFDDLRWRRDMQRATTSDRPDAFGSLSAESVALQGALATS